MQKKFYLILAGVFLLSSCSQLKRNAAEFAVNADNRYVASRTERPLVVPAELSGKHIRPALPIPKLNDQKPLVRASDLQPPNLQK